MERVTLTRATLLDVFSIRPFFFLWLAQLISQVGFNMLIFVLGVFIYERTRSNAAVSILYFTSGVPAALAGVIAGVYVDRFDKKRVLLATTIARIVILFLIMLSGFNYWLLYPLVIFISAVSQFFIPAEAALIPRLVPPHLLLPANSLFTITFYTAIIGGFVAGGPLLARLGDTQIMFLLILLFALTCFLILLLPSDKTLVHKNVRLTWSHIKADLLSGFQFILSAVRVRNAMLLMTLAQVVITIFLTLGPGFADHILHIAITDASLIILGPAALGMIVGALVTGMVGSRFKKKQLIVGGLISSGVLLIIVALLVHGRKYTFMESLFSISQTLMPLSMICFALLGLANALIDISCNTVMQESTPDAIRGRVYGVLSSIISGIALLPVVISGIVADVIGVGKMIFVLGVMLLFLSLIASGHIKVGTLLGRRS